MSGTRRNAALGWVVWKVGSRVVKKKAQGNGAKLGAAGLIALAVAGGLMAGRGGANA